MLSLFRLSQQCRNSTTLTLNKPLLYSLKHCISNNPSIGKHYLHTSAPRSAIPPVLLIVLRPALRLFAFFAGRNFRKWWQKLPKDRKQFYMHKVKENKVGIAGGGVLVTSLAYWFYASHLEIEPITGRERFCIVTPSQIKELSELEFKAICAEFADRIVPPNHPYYYRVKKIANRLLSANRNLPQIYTKTWTVTVLNDPKNVNAFVLPNGNIFVFTGMLDMCASNDELGAVLGHEIAHCLLSHAAENASREHLVESLKLLLILVAFAIFPTDLLSLLGYSFGAGAVNATLRYPYGRQLETEADEVGIQLAAKACFDVRAAIAFWAKMGLVEELHQEESIEWLSSHPSHKARQAKLEEQLPMAVELRNYCKCPQLPRRDPRDEVDAFKQSLQHARPVLLPVAVPLAVPDIVSTANAK